MTTTSLLAWGLRRVIHRGHLVIIGPDGRSHSIGQAGSKPYSVFRITDPKLPLKLILDGQFHFGQGYMDGSIVPEDGTTIRDFLDLFSLNAGMSASNGLKRIALKIELWISYLKQINPVHRSRANVSHHYDLSDALYSRFLDKDWQYSCGYFETPTASLEQAQLAKKRHLAAKLGLKPGMRVLDIGSGWGGLAIYLARVYDVDVTGITLSVEQHKVATQRAAEAGVSDRVRFILRDYRHETATYDRIVSVGMFEHVGVPHYNTFVRKVRDLLTPDGVALLHTIGRVDGPGTTNPWLRKYIFPGGYAPALSEVMPALERACVYVADIEFLRMHYAWTLKQWYDRFQASRADIAANLYDERFCRMWEFYLAGSEMDFSHTGTVVFQIQITRQIDALPFTRDYIYEAEAALRLREEALGL